MDAGSIGNDFEDSEGFDGEYQLVEDPRLQEMSEEFIDDNNVTVEKRCFMLCCGKDETDERNFFRLNVSLNVFEDDP